MNIVLSEIRTEQTVNCYFMCLFINNYPYFYIYKHILIPFVSIASFEMFLDYDMLILHPYPNVIWVNGGPCDLPCLHHCQNRNHPSKDWKNNDLLFDFLGSVSYFWDSFSSLLQNFLLHLMSSSLLCLFHRWLAFSSFW